MTPRPPALLVIFFSLFAVASAHAASIVVDRTDDDETASACTAAPGDCSLRGAVTAAIATEEEEDVITFDATVFATPQVITLTAANGPISTSGAVTLAIDGPGAGLLAISGGDAIGILEISGSAVTIEGLTFRNAVGAIRNLGPLVISDSVFADNQDTASDGGAAIRASSRVTVNNCLFTNNVSDGFGGAITISFGLLHVSGSTFTGNSSGGRGGAINTHASFTITGSTFTGNTAWLGGAVFAGTDNNVITASTFAGNSAQDGGAILNIGNLRLTNSTITGNSAVAVDGQGGKGGGLSNEFVARVVNTTISSNTATTGGGIYQNPNHGVIAQTVKNSIIASNTGGDCWNNGTGSGNIDTTDPGVDPVGACEGATHATAADVKLAPLADNGGPTWTQALLPGSIAIDAVADCTNLESTPAAVTTDQRGVARPQGTACDVGAFELVPDTTDPVLTVPDAIEVEAAGALTAVVFAHLVSATDDRPGVTVSCDPASGSLFPVGTTTVTCTATDASGNDAEGSFTVTVTEPPPPPAPTIADLMAQVNALSGPDSVKKPLMAKLQSALKQLEKGHSTPVKAMLSAFVNDLTVFQRNGKVPAAAAQAIIADVLQIIASL
jgi:predicted outer membrane repeat protein